MDLGIVTRVEDWWRTGAARQQDWPQQRRKVAAAFGISRQGAGLHAALVIVILLPGEEEECLVMTAVKLGNPHWTPEAPAVIVLMVARLDIRPVGNVVPGDGVQLVVMKQVKRGTMVRVSAGLSGKGLNATGSTAKFGGDSGGRNLELANGFNRRSVFIKSWTKLGVSN